MNKFEQVSSIGHQMSLARGVPVQLGPTFRDSMSSEELGLGRVWSLYSEVQCIIGNGHKVPPLTDTHGLKDYLH